MTQDKAKHTATPWSVDASRQTEGIIKIWAPGIPVLADVPLRFVSINEQKANAELIVTAVNSYDKQREALTAALDFVVAVKIAGQKGAPIHPSHLPETQLRESLKE